jgi:uncharacterized protein (TIGR03437 family)
MLKSQPAIVSVVNSASFQTGMPAGGALATSFVSGLGALKPGTYVAPAAKPLPYTLGGVTLVINNDYAPLLAVIVPSDPAAYVQVNFQVPLAANASLLAPYFRATYAGSLRVSDGVNVAAPVNSLNTSSLEQWGGFFGDANGYAAAVHASDLSPVTMQNPAHAGESIIAYADGFFLTWPRPPIGIPAPADVNFAPDYSLPASPGSLYLQAYPQYVSNCAPAPGPCTMSGTFPNTPPLAINSMGLLEGAVGVERSILWFPPIRPQAYGPSSLTASLIPHRTATAV